jgi:hypothetical protein
VLPAIEINWFNNKTQQVEHAHLPELTVHAIAAGSSQSISIPNQQQSLTTTEVSEESKQQSPISDWFWPALSAFLTVGWITNILWFYRRRSKSTENVPKNTEKNAISTAKKQLKAACQKHDSHAAKHALLAWGRQQFAKDNLTAIASCCPSALAQEILLLNQTLYSGNAAGWNGQSLWKAFDQADLNVNKAQDEGDGLQPLYRL